MKILQINTTVNSGSTGRIVEDIGRILIANGHDSYIAYGRVSGATSTSKLIKIGSDKDVYFHGAYTLLTDKHGFASKKATHNFIQEIEKIKPDAIGLHNLHGYYLNIEMLFAYLEKANTPVVWTFHDCWPFTGHCTYFDSVGCEKWKTQCETCPKTKMYPKSIGLDNSFKNYNDKKRIFNQVENLQIMTPSHWLKNLVRQSYFEHPVTCIHNGIDLNQFVPASDKQLLREKRIVQHRKIVLGVANTWDERKGLSDFIQLADALAKKYQIILIGLSEEQVHSIPENIIGIKRTESIAELASYYSMADVFVNPTYQDNFPTTNIEALACGTPVLTYNTGGSPEAIDEETGEVIPKGNIQLLKQAVEKWCATNTVETPLKCRLRAELFFNKEDRYAEYLKLYEQLVTSHTVYE